MASTARPSTTDARRWQLWVDTGGTFTDALACDPDGRLHRAKVLSTSRLRARVTAVDDVGRALRLDAPWTARAAPDFLRGARVGRLAQADDDDALDDLPRVTASRGARCTLDRPLGGVGGDGAGGDGDADPPAVFFAFDDEAPTLAARLLTGTPADATLPPIDLRLATTRGTNALLERAGGPVALFVTAGFEDVLHIGDQRRPDLFALDVRRPAPLPARVWGVIERLDASGETVTPLDRARLTAQIAELAAATDDAGRPIAAVAVALLHAYRHPAHEDAVAAALRDAGVVRHIARGAALSPTLGFLVRVETAVVDAYLAPVVAAYLARVDAALGPGSRVHVMTSAGSLVEMDAYRPKDSLLSGPAGGVVGAVDAARALGIARLIAFDMGGTSTDVSRWAGRFDYRFAHRVGDAEIAAPALAIETVAAGGGSVCHARDGRPAVGPHSAGASPGPACYGAGGPLAITDVNLLLGRIDPTAFEIPI
ncbi:MAG: hydantoinase/oxoprolinase family protein, partial [Acidobacteriota bacterium]